MDINNLAHGTKPQSGFSQHPNGIFAGTVQAIKPGHTKNTNTPYWDLQIRTDHGVAFYKIWGFTDQDVAKANTEQKTHDMVVGSIARTKGIFVDLGVWEPAVAENANWAGPSPSVMQDMQHLIGCNCTVNIQPSKKEAGRQVTYINPPSDGLPDVPDTPAGASNTQFPAPVQSSPAPVGIDDIPF